VIKIQKKETIFKVLFIAVVVLVLVWLFPTIAFARPDLAEEMSPMKKTGTLITTIFNSVCVVSAGITILQLVISRDQKAVSGAYKFFYTILATFIIFNSIGAILNYADTSIPKQSYDYSTGTLAESVDSVTTVNQKADTLSEPADDHGALLSDSTTN